MTRVLSSAAWLLLLSLTAVAGAQQRVLDLSHPFDQQTIYWPIDKVLDFFTWIGWMEPFEPYKDYFSYAAKKVTEEMLTVVVAQQMTV